MLLSIDLVNSSPRAIKTVLQHPGTEGLFITTHNGAVTPIHRFANINITAAELMIYGGIQLMPSKDNFYIVLTTYRGCIFATVKKCDPADIAMLFPNDPKAIIQARTRIEGENLN